MFSTKETNQRTFIQSDYLTSFYGGVFAWPENSRKVRVNNTVSQEQTKAFFSPQVGQISIGDISWFSQRPIIPVG